MVTCTYWLFGYNFVHLNINSLNPIFVSLQTTFSIHMPLIRLEVDMGSVLESELGQKWRYGVLKQTRDFDYGHSLMSTQ